MLFIRSFFLKLLKEIFNELDIWRHHTGDVYTCTAGDLGNLYATAGDVEIRNGGINRYRAQRNARASVPVIMPRISHEVDWEVMSDTVRKEIQQRNTGINRETERLEAQLQAKLKTIELFEADIQIAKLERELLKIKHVAVLPEPETKKRRRTKKQSETVMVEDVSSKIPPQVYQLREALKGSGLSVPVNDSARH